MQRHEGDKVPAYMRTTRTHKHTHNRLHVASCSKYKGIGIVLEGHRDGLEGLGVKSLLLSLGLDERKVQP